MNQVINMDKPEDRSVLISGAGIAGLTLGILLKEDGWEPLLIERDPALRTEGYMMDFFGTGWDVAARMGIDKEIRDFHYPIDYLEYVDREGRPRFSPVPLDRIRWALDYNYVYLRRPDLERILFDRAVSSGVTIRFGSTIRSVVEHDSGVEVQFEDGTQGTFRLLFGADGVHSRVRELVFGPEREFERFLGYYVAALHIPERKEPGRNSVTIYEEPGRVVWIYPRDEQSIDAVYLFEHAPVGHIPRKGRLSFVKEQFRGAHWIAESLLAEHPLDEPVYFDSTTQIVMPAWHKGRIALLGDACGCLTLIAGQGSHMAMAGAYVIARELRRHNGDHSAAFRAYEQFLRPIIRKKQEEAVRTAKTFVPPKSGKMIGRYLFLRVIFSRLLIRWFFSRVGAKSVLEDYR
jgi:2-polyprenyl-6-methoxyphenol hydroxylase-like FAD-dependent oxidoreductase